MKLSLSPLGAIYINYRRRYTDILLGADAQIREAKRQSLNSPKNYFVHEVLFDFCAVEYTLCVSRKLRLVDINH